VAVSVSRWIRAWSRYRQRRQLGGSAPQLTVCWDALPDPSTPWQKAEFLVVDTETSGLELESSELLSIGWVVMRGDEIDLSSSEHRLLLNHQGVGQSATIHQLRDCELQEGEPLEDVFLDFLEMLRGRVLVFHHAPLDLAFLNRQSEQQLGSPLLLPVIDTLQLERRQLLKAEQPIVDGVLRLASCRRRHQLPDYPAHNALVDALSTAELLLAQLQRRGGDTQLGQLLSFE
jgi:DNA polymerase III subunit epsilon